MKLNHPLTYYVTISVISLLCAVALFMLGGSLAEVTGNDESLLGFSFKAGGGVAGFIIIFMLSQNMLLKFKRSDPSINVKVYLKADPVGFKRGAAYSGEYVIFNSETGTSTVYQVAPFWEAGYLTVLATNIAERDFLSIKIRDVEARIWESDSFHSRCPQVISLNLINY